MGLFRIIRKRDEERFDLSKKPLDEITKSCSLCEYARRIEITGEILCTRTKNLKKVSDDDVCRKFSFDILAYKPNPTKLPRFRFDSVDEIL